MDNINLKGLFKRKYGNDLQGVDWINRIDPEDKHLLIRYGLAHAKYGKLGGIARARNAERDSRGRFV